MKRTLAALVGGWLLGLASLSAQPGGLPAPGALLDQSGFARRRVIPSGPRGLTALRLDAAVLAQSSLNDLRIVGSAGRQVPYVLEHLDEPLAVDLPRLERTAVEGLHTPPSSGSRSTYRLRLPAAGLPGSHLVIDTPASVFARAVHVFREQRDPRARSGRVFDEVAEGEWSHRDPESPAPSLSLLLPSGLPAMLWLVVDEGDNAPLPLARPRLLLPSIRLRFFRDTDEALSLVYGNPSIAAPRYDLELLAPRLAGEPAWEVWPGAEQSVPPAGRRLLTPVRAFWVALAAAVVILLLLLARLLRT